MNEEGIYEQISAEIKSGNTKKGLWTKAFTESEGDGKKTKALYIEHRFNQIKDSQPKVQQEEKAAEEKVSKDYKINLSDGVKKEEKIAEEMILVNNSDGSDSSKEETASFYGYVPLVAIVFLIAIFVSSMLFMLISGYR